MTTGHARDSTSSRPVHPGRRRDPHVAERPAPTPDPRSTWRPSAARSAPARAFLGRFAWTLAVLLLGMTALLLGWNLASGTDWASSHPWLTATAATTIWVLAAAVWLRRRGWRRRPVHAVTWTAPAAGLLPLVCLGWLTPDGLVLWGPVSTLFAVALAMAADPMRVDGVLGGQMRVVLDGAEPCRRATSAAACRLGAPSLAAAAERWLLVGDDAATLSAPMSADAGRRLRGPVPASRVPTGVTAER